jgi:hypothetical protein
MKQGEETMYEKAKKKFIEKGRTMRDTNIEEGNIRITDEGDRKIKNVAEKLQTEK